MHFLVKDKYTKIYLFHAILQIHVHIYVLNKNTLQLYFLYTNMVYLVGVGR